jgi:sugar phosphate isomerase/epimerase
MKVGVLSAALQELTPRERRDTDPDLAIEEWLAFARDLGADVLQVFDSISSQRRRCAAGSDAGSGREHIGTFGIRSAANERDEWKRAVKSTGVPVSDLAYFDNLLHHDPASAAGSTNF